MAFNYTDLVEWSSTLPAWQREAMRRILAVGELTDATIAELSEMAKAAAVSAGEASNATIDGPLVDHSAEPLRALPKVGLAGLRDIARANALGTGPIAFASDGLTVVYGGNGTGKSSFARILKRSCRAVEPGDAILPCAFDETNSGPAVATIEYTVDGTATTYRFVDGSISPEELRTVTVFDAACARRSVDQRNPVSYAPYLLTIFRMLALVCERVSDRLRAERDALGSTPNSVAGLRADLGTGTASGRYLANLSMHSSVEELRQLCSLTVDDEGRATALRGILNQGDIERKIALADARVRRIEALDRMLETLDARTSDAACESFLATVSEARSSAVAASTASAAFSADAALEGLGSDPWRQLWESARRYSESHAYSGERFPFVAEDASCVLCQQPLDGQARERMQAFEEFVKADVQQAADKSASALSIARAQLLAVEAPRAARAAVQDAELEAEAGQARASIVSCRLRRRFLLRASRGGMVAPLPASHPRPSLAGAIAAARQHATELRAAQQSAERDALLAELRELEGRERIAAIREAVEAEIERLGKCVTLDESIRTCNTAPITRKQGEAERSLVTERLGESFLSNLYELGFGDLPIAFRPGPGRQGERHYGPSLEAPRELAAGSVLSEGERTCVALAGLLAELDTTENRSALVLDDPVSSLDHNFRERVAKRLAVEAKQRQVIVFTHDVLFYFLLKKYAKASSTNHKSLTLRRGSASGGHGRAKDGSLWEMATVSERISSLRRDALTARAYYKAGESDDYDRSAREIYERLRQSWERAVEEILLNEVVTRFDDRVQTQRLRKIADDVKLADVERLDIEMSYCSGIVHDRPAAGASAMPSPDVVDKDIGKLGAWVDEVKGRRK